MNIVKIDNRWLRLTMGEEQANREDHYATKVLQKKSIGGLLPLRKRNIDGICFFDYSIIGLHTIQEAWEGRLLNESDVDAFVLGLKQALLHIKDYLLNCGRLCINPSYIMYDAGKRVWQFLYIVEPYENQQNDIKELLEFFMSKTGGMNEDNSIIYEYLSDCLQFEEGLSLTELVSAWEERKHLTAAKEEMLQEEIHDEREETGKDGIAKAENTAGRTEPDMEEDDVCGWKDRWNKMVYAKLYLVPFSPH